MAGSIATKLSGHKGEQVYRRYARAERNALREGVRKLAALNSGTIAAQSH